MQEWDLCWQFTFFKLNPASPLSGNNKTAVKRVSNLEPGRQSSQFSNMLQKFF